MREYASRVLFLVTVCFGVALLGPTACAQELHLKASRGLAGRQTMRTGRNGMRHAVVQFDHPPDSADLDSLMKSGARVIAAIPDNGVMVVFPANAAPPVSAQWSGSLQPEEKLSKELLQLGWNAAVIEFHADVTDEEQDLVGAEEGVLFTRNPGLRSEHVLAYGSYADLASLAAHDEVAYIFPADPALWGGGQAALRSCAGMLTQNGPVAQYSNIVHGWDLDSDFAAHLNYVFGEMTSKLPSAQVQSEIARAMSDWSKNASIVFQPSTGSSSAPKTLLIRFASGPHGDSFPFDGAGGTLAHTFYPVPVNAEPIAGDMHLDADENWHVGGDIDLYSVVLHELGHAIGLGHSDVPGDVMYPYYRTSLRLTKNDIGAAQQLYGPPVGSSTPTGGSPMPAPVTPTIPNPTTPNPTTPNPTTPAPAVPAPVLTLNAAPSSTVLSTIDLSGTLKGGATPVNISWLTDRGLSGKAVLSNGTAWLAGKIPLQPGVNTISVSAMDAQHRSVTVVAVTTMSVPATGPYSPMSISLQSPAGTVVTVGASAIVLAGVATGGAGIAKVTWKSSTGTSGLATGSLIGTNYRWSAVDVPLLTGTNTILVQAWDTTGNSAWRSVYIIRR